LGLQRLIAQSIEPMNAVNDAATGGKTILRDADHAQAGMTSSEEGPGYRFAHPGYGC